MRRCLLVVLASVLVVGLLGSCSEENGETGGEGWQPCRPSTGAVPHPTGPRDVVLRIGQRGGMPPLAYVPDSLPDLTLYGDGRLVGIDESTSGRLVPGLVERRLTNGEVRKLLHGAEAACLLQSGTVLQRDTVLDLPGTFDVPGISFEVKAGAGSHLTYVVGLGIAQMERNVPDDQKEHRAALVAFMNGALGLLDEATPIPTDRLGVFFTKLDGAPAVGDVPSVTWPLDRRLATFGEASPEAYPDVHCAVATGKDAAVLLAAVEGMKSGRLPYWRDGTSWYQLELRPMLPDERNCAALVA